MTGFLIAGTASGVGKTTVTLALIAALRRRGLVVQPFKGGPDFLDTGHHTRIAGRIARNLDTWMLSAEANRDVLRQAATGANVLIAEGMMGLFDGKSGTSDSGSSAEIAKLLGLPVLLVLDAGKSARSIAATVLGFELFDPDLPLAGVILNRVASQRHYQMLEAAIRTRCHTPILGWLPRDPAIVIPERHLGLQTAEEAIDTDALINTLATLAEQQLDLDAILELTCSLDLASTPQAAFFTESAIRIGLARDRAFTFYYEDNLDLLRGRGATIVPFSPLEDTELPPELDALYLGGGYPELHPSQLAANTSLLADIRSFASSGRPIYAECGGMIYLAHTLKLLDGSTHPLANLLPFSVEMTSRLVQFGYVNVTLTHDCLLGPAGTTLRGHSFHHSRIPDTPAVDTAYDVTYSLSGLQEAEGYCVGNILASYLHVHFRTNPELARHFVQAARAASLVNH